MLKQELTVRLQQKLSPLQYQTIKMLEYPAADLEEVITKELEENPALDEGADENRDDFDSNNFEKENTAPSEEDMYNDLDIMEKENFDNSFEYISKKKSNIETPTEILYTRTQSFLEYLNEQISLLKTDETTLKYAEYLVGNINEDGYLMRDLEYVIDDLAFQMGIIAQEADMQKALDLVQSLEPAGVGARNLQECMLLQLKRLPQRKNIQIAIKIIEEYFEKFKKKQPAQILQKLNISAEEYQEAITEIFKLNPKPGSAFSGDLENSFMHVIPDFIVEEEGGKLYVALTNSNVPELRVSPAYIQMLSDFSDKNVNEKTRQAFDFAKQKVDSAKWFIESIKQRNSTLLRTMIAIVKAQHNFFLTGDASQLKPMKLQDIADVVGYDASTVSRVSNSKYVQTMFGIYSLKSFFSEAVKTSSGKMVSNRKIIDIIKQMIEDEDKSNPITDDAITSVLQKKGYVIARRTVAKYREKLNIPSTRHR
jgi:RNA polymerase sigma-54 factor